MLEQSLIDKLRAYGRRWRRLGWEAGPTDRAAAEAGVRAAYAAAGLPPPRRMIWCGSPRAGQETSRKIDERRQGKPERRWMPFSVRLSDPEDYENVRPFVVNDVFATTRRAVQLASDFLADTAIRRQFLDALRESSWSLAEHRYGAFWPIGRSPASITSSRPPGELALCEYLREIAGMEAATPAAGLADAYRACGWWWAFRDVAVLSERPAECAMDDWGRLHNPSGPALRYPDGWAVYAMHGVQVPDRYVTAFESLTAAEIRSEQNLELRRTLVERYGFGRFLRDSRAKIVHRDECGELYYLEQFGEHAFAAVRVVNATPEPDGTRREYFLHVHPGILTAREAVAWTFGLRAEEYAPERES